ncbi:MAG: alpha/beta hydrolase [Rhizomicrobium sp.]
MTLAGGEVSYLEWAAQAPLLHFAHATGFNAQTYRGLLTPLQGRFRVAAADLRGHGFTTLPAVPGPQAAWNNFGDDLAAILDRLDPAPAILAAILDRLDPAPAILAGHSMGAITGLMVAAARPERVRGLVLVEPVLVPRFARPFAALRRLLGWAPPPGTDLVSMAAKRRAIFPSFEAALATYRGRGAFKTWPEETVADYLRGGLISTGNGTEMRLACAPAWESAIFRNAPPGDASLARRVKCPLTLIYCGDGTAKEREVKLVARLHGDVRLVKVPGTTHFLPMERPDIVQDEIARMLKVTA